MCGYMESLGTRMYLTAESKNRFGQPLDLLTLFEPYCYCMMTTALYVSMPGDLSVIAVPVLSVK